MKYLSLVFFLALQTIYSAAPNSDGSFVLPSWLGNQMVLPVQQEVQLQGKASHGSEVKLEFASIHLKTKTNKTGDWELLLPVLDAASKGQTLKISSDDTTHTFSDVVVGKIWLCAGQSNMAMPLRATKHEKEQAEKEIQAVDVRYFDGNSWIKLDKKNMAKISAVGIWFAIETAKRTNAPVAISIAARGGTGIEAWVPKNHFPESEFGQYMKRLANDPAVLKAADEDSKAPKTYGQHRLAKWGLTRGAPAWMFQKYVVPLTGLPIQGTVWYQGESNAMSLMNEQEYGKWLKSLINGWKTTFNNPNMSFVIIQLPEYDARTEAFKKGWVTEPVKVNQCWTEVQMAQKNITKNIKGVYSISTKGLGELENIHPRNKKEVGRRAAALTAMHHP